MAQTNNHRFCGKPEVWISIGRQPLPKCPFWKLLLVDHKNQAILEVFHWPFPWWSFLVKLGISMGCPARHGATPIAGGFILRKIPSFEMDDEVPGYPMSKQTPPYAIWLLWVMWLSLLLWGILPRFRWCFFALIWHLRWWHSTRPWTHPCTPQRTCQNAALWFHWGFTKKCDVSSDFHCCHSTRNCPLGFLERWPGIFVRSFPGAARHGGRWHLQVSGISGGCTMMYAVGVHRMEMKIS